VVIVPPVALINSAATAPLKSPMDICPEEGIGPATGEGVPGGTKPPPA
jgi:hypothetical protein